MTVDFPGLLLAALLCAEAAAVGLAAWHAREPDRFVELAIGTYKLNPRTTARFRRWRWRFSPLVLLLTFALADELAQAALHAALDGAPRPLAGWARVGWHVSIALSLGWPAALAAACWRASEPKKEGPEASASGPSGRRSPVATRTTEGNHGARTGERMSPSGGELRARGVFGFLRAHLLDLGLVLRGVIPDPE